MITKLLTDLLSVDEPIFFMYIHLLLTTYLPYMILQFLSFLRFRFILAIPFNMNVEIKFQLLNQE